MRSDIGFPPINEDNNKTRVGVGLFNCLKRFHCSLTPRDHWSHMPNAMTSAGIFWCCSIKLNGNLLIDHIELNKYVASFPTSSNWHSQSEDPGCWTESDDVQTKLARNWTCSAVDSYKNQDISS